MWKKIILSLTLVLLAANANAVSMSRPLGGEKRIKIINYMPNTVFKFTGHYLFQSIIEFALDEDVQTISMGTSSPWQLVPAGNRIFIKPVEDNATTNMTVITNKRMYFFEMHAEEADGISDENLAFIVKFVYPEDSSFNALKQVKSNSGPDLSKPELYNLNYTISGSAKDIEPMQVFDDGEFTYLKFRDINSEIPAIFNVDKKGNESLVNFRISNGYVVVERVSNRFTLRHGRDTICVFNEDYDDSIQNNKKNLTANRTIN